ncbi:lipopolysaccharide biosynthesis protein [Phenylobacterium sp.]|uniref:lipopolysaccharide biosynthesis protein n=1 Tax=Phenylobacterium sp. TaxID=1871053 RepID=UPI00273155EE|nr:oligosaccharide flippase family protein [Phenylobacterium sp.]MDP2213495.1 oligosaccharide flippase family protein [Phenylobacterium sp.]
MSFSRIASKARAEVLSLIGEDFVAKIAARGVLPLSIKVGAAGLSFLMFLVLARSMSPEDYGRFGFGFALANLLAVAGSAGRRALILRYVPVYRARQSHALRLGIIRDGYQVVMTGCGALAIGLIALALLWPGLEARGYLVAAAALTFVLGLAEYQAPVMRTLAGTVLAQVPRDLLWRIGVILGATLSAIGILGPLNAMTALSLSAGVLAGVVIGQAYCHPLTRPRTLFGKDAEFERQEWRHTALGLWGTSVVRVAAPNLAVVILGLIMAPAETAPFFAALRTAMLLNLFLLASNLEATPRISRLFHQGKLRKLQHLCSLLTIGVSLPTMFVFVIFALFGGRILQLFGPGYDAAWPVLMILSTGYLINALSGPTSQIMEVTGNERAYLRMITVTNLIAIAAIWPMVHFAGSIGAAIAVTFALAAWNTNVYRFVFKRYGIAAGIIPLHLFKKRPQDGKQ